jgi:hypothetical protein
VHILNKLVSIQIHNKTIKNLPALRNERSVDSEDSFNTVEKQATREASLDSVKKTVAK